jgi:hypothetical protein
VVDGSCRTQSFVCRASSRHAGWTVALPSWTERFSAQSIAVAFDPTARRALCGLIVLVLRSLSVLTQASVDLPVVRLRQHGSSRASNVSGFLHSSPKL